MRSADLACFSDPDPFVTMRDWDSSPSDRHSSTVSAFEVKFLLGGV